jgi:phosphoribosylglycinamide formyltransferase 1
MINLGILASGRGTNLKAIIDAVESGYINNACIATVISNKEDALALGKAREHHIPTLFLNPKMFKTRELFDLEIAQEMDKHKVDLIVLAGYMQILSQEFVRRFQGRIMNIHPALLPSFPGLHAQRDALRYGVKITGCTVHFVTDEVDVGPIIIQYPVPVKKGDTEESLSERILEKEHKIYPKAIKLYAEKRLKIIDKRVEIL